MSGSGSAHNSYLYGGATGNPVSVTDAGNIGVQSTYTKVKNIGKYVLRTSAARQLPDVPAAWVSIFSKEGNGTIWIGGYGDDIAQVGIGTPLLEGHHIALPCTNLNQFSLIPESDGSIVYITAGLSGKDVALTPANEPDLDLTPPSVTSTSPTTGATNQEANVLISIQMSEAIDAATVSNTTVTVSPSFTYTATLDSTDNTVIRVIHPSNLTLSTTYTITLHTGIKDLVGNALASNYSFSFTTKSAPPPPDTTPPTIVSYYPNNGATVDSSIIPSITFSEAMLLSSFNSYNLKIVQASNNQTMSASSFSLSADQKTVYVNSPGLTGSNTYYFVCGAALFLSNAPTDLAGNQCSSSLNSTFYTSSSTTTSTVYNVTGDTWDPIGGSLTNYEIKETVASTSSALYQITPTKYIFKLKKTGSPSGNITIKIIHNNASTFTLKRTIGTISTSSVGTSETAITVNDAANTYKLGTNDQIVVNYTGGDSSNYIQVKTSSSDAFDGSRTYKSKTNSSDNNADYTSSDLAMQVDGF